MVSQQMGSSERSLSGMHGGVSEARDRVRMVPLPLWRGNCGRYLCLDEDRIAGGLGVIDNDFHERKDLSPNICAVYTEEEYRCKGIAGQLLDLAVNDLKTKGVTPVYLITDHTSFYERYGWEFFCMVNEENNSKTTRMYIHR